MESARIPTDTRNIPHMQLFHHLKQKFPDLRDNDVNESIQKYGLDRERCEEELSQRTQIHPGGYYGPWGRSSSALSSPTASRVTSPLRTGIPSSPTTHVITTTTASPPPLHHTTATHHVFGPVQCSGYLVYSYGPGMIPGPGPVYTSPCSTPGPGPVYTSPCSTPVTTSSVLYQPPINNGPNYGWHASPASALEVTEVPSRTGVMAFDSEETSPTLSRETSKSRSNTPVPKSAPVLSNSYDPFAVYENRDPPERRRSAETHYDGRKGLYYNKHNFETFERFANPHSPTPSPINNSALDSPATSTSTTTTFTDTECSNVDPVIIASGNLNRPPPVVQEQSLRKQKLETELSKQIEEKGKLLSEVEMMAQELEARDRHRKENADASALKIEEVQRENQRLQSECDEMENKLLRIAPELGQDYPDLPPNQPFHETSAVPQLPRASSGSNVSSGTATPQTPHTPHTAYSPRGVFIPQRPVVPPPPPPPLPNLNYQGLQGVSGSSIEEMGPKWGCTKCTFLNHPDMNKCEMCDCPRFTIGELQDIHIQVRHQNFQSPRKPELHA